MYDQVRQLYENQLWSSLCQFGPLVLTVAANHQVHAPCKEGAASTWTGYAAGSDSHHSASVSSSHCNTSTPSSGSAAVVPTTDHILSSRQRLVVMAMLAEAFFESKEFRRAESILKEALYLRKHLGKTKTSSVSAPKDDLEDRLLSEVELKYKLHECYLHLQQPAEALNVLQSIPAKQKSIKCNMAVGRLFRRAGMDRQAITCFREVLKACPMAIDAAQALMQLGIKPREIQELTLEATSTSPRGMEWFGNWVQAHAALASRDYSGATQAFQNLDEQSLLHNEMGVLVSLGMAHYYNGDYSDACLSLQRLEMLDPNNLSGMDCLAAALCRERRGEELERLATRLMSVTEEAPEPWIAMGYYCYLNKKGNRAVYFAHKACLMDQRNVEALLLKGNVLLDLKKVHDALSHFREAMGIAPYRYDLQKGLIDCYLAQNKYREAASVATTACKQMSNSARSLTLCASVVVKDPYQTAAPRAKTYLEKALNHDATYLPAVYLLAEILDREGHAQEAITLLKKQLTHQSNSKLHQVLADLLAKTHDDEKAMEHYTSALNLDPKNVHAQEGLKKIEQSNDGHLDAAYDLEMEDLQSDEGELEESETEAVWSDGDLNLAASSSNL